jgi:3-deoxy-7-phosphoheptulonate synthase
LNRPEWTPASWRAFPTGQQPAYPSAEALETVLRDLAALPPLVTPWEVDELRHELAEAASGRRFLLQGGDCAESFADCGAAAITSKVKILLQMSLVLVHGVQKPVIRVGRFAGQYAKPRSTDTEQRNGVTLPSYRGDLVNGSHFDKAARTPDPVHMLRGYERSALTLNYIRALARGGFADLRHPENWSTDFIEGAELAAEYQQILVDLAGSLRFMENVLGVHADAMQRVEFFTSHEALLLPYEQAQTREERGAWYNLGTHFPWIGARTLEPDGGHVEYLRGIANPIGIKVAPGMGVDSLVRLLDILDEERTPGRITLIHRMGAQRISTALPPLIRALKASGRIVLWCCDPMHGNTRATSSGVKTRRFGDIISEVRQAFELHAAEASVLGGVHLELSGEHVTECVGGSRAVQEADLELAYKSEVDPRLNYEQALELAMLIARHLRSTQQF